MQIQLIPKGQKPNDLVDYTLASYKRLYTIEGTESLFYFCIHDELIGNAEEGFTPTGRYLIVLLHPEGLSTFFVEPNDKDGWDLSEGEYPTAKQYIIDFVTSNICDRNM